MEREKNLNVRKNSQHSKVTVPRVFRLMNLMHKETKKAGVTFSKGLTKSLLTLISDHKIQQENPPPLPVDVQSLRQDLEIEKAKVRELSKAVDDISDIALNYKAEAMAERVENKRFINFLTELLPKKITETLNITQEKISEGRVLRVKQALHSMKKPEKLSAEEQN